MQYFFRSESCASHGPLITCHDVFFVVFMQSPHLLHQRAAWHLFTFYDVDSAPSMSVVTASVTFDGSSERSHFRHALDYSASWAPCRWHGQNDSRFMHSPTSQLEENIAGEHPLAITAVSALLHAARIQPDPRSCRCPRDVYVFPAYYSWLLQRLKAES